MIALLFLVAIVSAFVGAVATALSTDYHFSLSEEVRARFSAKGRANKRWQQRVEKDAQSLVEMGICPKEAWATAESQLLKESQEALKNYQSADKDGAV